MNKKGIFLGLIILVVLFGIIFNMHYVLADNDSSVQNNNDSITSSNSNNTGEDNNESTDNGNSSNDETPSLISTNDKNNNESEDNSVNSSDKREETAKICCHIYGFGANMEKVNSKYEMMEKRKCAVPENLVGGGREAVAYSLCKKTLTDEEAKKITKIRNRIKAYYSNNSECPNNCTCAGSTIKCTLSNGTREMTIHAGNSGNIIVQVKGINMSTNVTLYKSEDGKVYGVFKNNETKGIILPDEVREKIRERTKARLNGTNITLDENGEYNYEVEKESKFLGLFRIKEKMHWTIDAETSEIISENSPWWGFLSSDVKEE